MPTLPPAALPKSLEGVITAEEFQSLIKFQQQVNESPQVKDLITKITALRQQLQQLQAELSKIRTQAVADNPGMKALADKVQQAMRAHAPMPFGSTGTKPATTTPTPLAPAAGPPAAKP